MVYCKFKFVVHNIMHTINAHHSNNFMHTIIAFDNAHHNFMLDHNNYYYA